MKTKDKIIISQILIAVIGLTAILYGTRINIPDNEYSRYGLIFEWGENTIVTIAGHSSF